MSAITDNQVQSMKGRDSLGPVLQGPQLRHQPSSSSSRHFTMAERMECLEGKMHQQGKQLQQLTDYQYACNTTIKGMMRMLAIEMVVDMEQFPTMPAFSGRPLAEEHTSSQPMDDGDDEGDDEDDEAIE